MSSINSKHIDGDVSVGRNAAVGGDVTVQGKSQFKGNVKIEGWLEAKNIKAAAKGLFSTIEKLKAAYPLPHDGWWALVGTSLPADIYVGDGGEWVPTGQQGGNPTIDSGKYNEAVEKLQEDINDLQDDVVELTDKNKQQDTQLTTLGDSVNLLNDQMSATKSIADAASKKANEVGTQLDEFKQSKGESNGLAPLDGQGKVPSSYLPAFVDDVLEFGNIVTGITVKQQSSIYSSFDEHCTIVFDKDNAAFLLYYVEGAGVSGTYYANWKDADNFGTAGENGVTPYSGKVFLCIEDGKSYRWSGSQLAAIGSDLALGHTEATAFPGNEGKALQEEMTGMKQEHSDIKDEQASLVSHIVARSVINVNKLFGIAGKITFSVALDRCTTSADASSLQIPGVVLTFLTDAGWVSKQWTNTTEWNNENNWTDFGTGGNSVGNTVNVNDLCGDNEYTLKSAIQAVIDFEEESGDAYLKSGIVITFKTAETDSGGAPVWATYQFTRDVSDIDPNDEKPWIAFGSGNGSVSTSDKEEEDGKDAFSTGGAYNLAKKSIGGFNEESDEDYIYYKAVDALGQDMEDVQIRVPKNGGGGGSSEESTLSIYFEEAAPTKAYGGDIIVNVALRSVSYPGGSEVLGVIRNITIIDASTGITLYSEDMNEVGSASATDYKFELDFTSYFTGASSKNFYVQATDADGNTKRKAITITAVDVTVEQPMALNYTSSTALTVGGQTKSIAQFYKFPNNSSSILCTVEMLWNGVWKTLGTATVNDSYTKSISINPSNVFGGGERMAHGAYPVRIYGTEVKSGVKGNTIYSAVMCVDASNNTPIVVIRFNDENNGQLRLYDNLMVEVAAYTSGKTETPVEVYYDNDLVTSANAMIAETITVSKQVSGHATDGSEKITVHAESGTARTNDIEVKIVGSAIDAAIKDGALFGYDFSTRSNSETDHTIKDNGVEMTVKGANWSSNGFVDYLGERSLRIAENVTAEIAHAPFGTSAVERTNGCAIQFAFATKNIKEADSMLIECYDPDSGAGFYVCGNRAAIFCKSGQPALAERSFKCGEKITMAVVVEPSTIYVSRGGSNYSTIKMYLNGEEVACIGYIANSGAILNSRNIRFNGTDGDLYLYYFLAYDSHYEWAQAFQNYLCKLTDTAAMIAEYEAEDVLDTQNRPTIEALSAKGIPYYVVVADQSTFDSFDGDIDTSTKFSCTLFYYDPKKPWRSFKAINVQWRRQGTTSAKRPIKNDRFYLQKNDGWAVTPIYPDYTTEEAQRAYDLMEIGYVQVGENTIPVKIITVKVDYSDSSGANDCGVCDLMNATYRALGSNYMTPAQRAYDGTWKKGDVSVTGLQMNHSTANHPIAAFRSTMESLTDAWFHAKGNWKEDKGEQVALGFQDTPGYNEGCLNYGDFVEYFGTRDETLDAIETRFKNDETTDKSKLYLLSQYCGRDYRFMAYESGAWTAKSGSMKQVDGKWQITGKVLNPVSGFELLSYDGLNWWQGVGSIDDMMEPTTAEASWVTKLKLGQPTYPMWTRYFECMIDDDQLQIDLAMGRKVPYDLYNILVFCDSCDYAKEELDGTWQEIWKTEMWKKINPYSLIAYYAFTDYLAAVDQQAKNMQPMFFLEDGCSVENGVYKGANGMEPIRMYCNKVYDCDTCNGKDNDGGQTIDPEVDPGDLNSTAYAGRGSVLWNNIRGQQTMQIDQNGNTVTLTAIVDTMRSLPDTLGIGAGAFSPQGANYYFVTQRLKKWPKLVSSYDGERKYIHYTGYSDLYFYALQGLGLTSLPAFIEQRWRIRDGYYRCGDFKAESGYIGGRIGAKEGAVIRFKAAKSGYFGIGNDSGNITEGMFLEAGKEGVFTNFQHGENIMLYIYQADRMSELDLSEISIDPQFGNSLSKMTLLQKLYIGSETHSNWTMTPGNTGFMSNLDLGDMPFLTHLDVRNTEVVSINATLCPRLESVLATETQLSTINLAETSPISELALPDTMTEIVLNNLPDLTYPGGLTIAGVGKVNKIFLNGCENVDAMTLLEQVVKASSLKTLRIPNVNVTASVELLRSIKTSGAIGLDANGNAYDESGQCSGITGRWILTELVEDSEVESLHDYFKELTIYNAQYSHIVFNDEESDCKNITNMENKTGYLYGNTFAKSGHFAKIEAESHAYRAIFDIATGKMKCRQLSDTDYNYFADGSEIDLTDVSGEGFDIMKLLKSYWYKGVNDYKNQQKHFFASSLKDEPLSTANRVVRKKLGDILEQELTSVFLSNNSVGQPLQISQNANHNTYSMDVEGMKQVRFPGVNSSTVGAAFLDADDNVVGMFNMYVTHSLFDFVPGEYVFTKVPQGAKRFVFSSQVGFDDVEAIAVDSDAIEAIEPDWVHTVDRLIGVYGASVDNLKRLRSISGVKTQTGTNTSTTNNQWLYDDDGNITNTSAPTTTMHYTMKDFQNLAQFRKNGYQLIDYEMSKDIANLVMALTGTRDIQAICGYGCGSAYTTGANSLNTYGNQTRLYTGNNIGNLIFGIQNFVGCNSEWLDNVAVNVLSYKDFLRNKGNASTGDEVNHVWHIYDPDTDTERTVQGINVNGYCIGRVKFGRFADVIASRCTSDNSFWNKNYSDAQYYSASTCRVVLRSSNYANANGGLVYAHAFYASSVSYTSYGSRLAFRGAIEIEEQ